MAYFLDIWLSSCYTFLKLISKYVNENDIQSIANEYYTNDHAKIFNHKMKFMSESLIPRWWIWQIGQSNHSCWKREKFLNKEFSEHFE